MDAVLYAQSCDILLVIGTSAVVYPAAGIITISQSAGAKIIEINPEETFLSPAVDYFMEGKAGEVLPDLIKDRHL
jgi:NAD-dependent deacetylase